MVRSESGAEHDYANTYTIVLRYLDVPVVAGVARVFGEELAELPLIATKQDVRRQGHAKVLVSAFEEMLRLAGVVRLTLPAASETVLTWRHGFHFESVPEEVLNLYKAEFRMLIFPGTHVMSKDLVPSVPPFVATGKSQCVFTVTTNTEMRTMEVPAGGMVHRGMMGIMALDQSGCRRPNHVRMIPMEWVQLHISVFGEPTDVGLPKCRVTTPDGQLVLREEPLVRKPLPPHKLGSADNHKRLVAIIHAKTAAGGILAAPRGPVGVTEWQGPTGGQPKGVGGSGSSSAAAAAKPGTLLAPKVKRSHKKGMGKRAEAERLAAELAAKMAAEEEKMRLEGGEGGGADATATTTTTTTTTTTPLSASLAPFGVNLGPEQPLAGLTTLVSGGVAAGTAAKEVGADADAGARVSPAPTTAATTTTRAESEPPTGATTMKVDEGGDVVMQE